MNKILIGSNNPAKIEVYRKLLEGFKLQVLTAKDLKIPPPEDSAVTFEETAIDKAKYYYQKSGIPSIVDDGGFEIQALHPEPVFRGRRWVGREMTDDEIIEDIIKRMKNIPKNERSCKHIIVMALATPFGVFTAHGEMSGVVADKPSDKRVPQFPYESIIYLPNYNKYWAELSDEENEYLSHRRVALEKIKDILQELSK